MTVRRMPLTAAIAVPPGLGQAEATLHIGLTAAGGMPLIHGQADQVSEEALPIRVAHDTSPRLGGFVRRPSRCVDLRLSSTQ